MSPSMAGVCCPDIFELQEGAFLQLILILGGGAIVYDFDQPSFILL